MVEKKVAEESEDKSKQLAELQKNFKQLKLSFSTNETNRQVCTSIQCGPSM